jgi:hypothetical protein
MREIQIGLEREDKRDREMWLIHEDALFEMWREKDQRDE